MNIFTLKARFKILCIGLFMGSVAHLLQSGAVTQADQQQARNNIVEHSLAKQQKQNELNSLDAQIGQKNFQLLKLRFKAAGVTTFITSGSQKDPLHNLVATVMDADVQLLEREIARLEQQRQNIIAQIQQHDQQIAQASDILSKPTRPELDQDLSNYNQSVRNHEEHIRWLGDHNKPQQEIDDTNWILINERRRRDQIRQQINEGDYREPQPVNDQQSSQNSTSSQQPPPPWFNPSGQTVAGPFSPNADIQRTSFGSATQQSQSNTQTINTSPSSSQTNQPNYPPPGYWPNRPQSPWIPSIPGSYSGGGSSGSSGSGHSHTPSGQDAGSSGSSGGGCC